MNQTAKYSYFVKIVKIDSNSTPESIAGICLGQRFDGVVCYGVTFSKMNNTDFIEKLHLLLTHKNIPMTIAGGSYPINKAIHITPNDKQGGRLAFEHLYALGHKTFFIPFEYCRESWANDRLCGFHEAAQNAGITLLDKYIPKSKMIFNYTVKKLQDIFCSSERPTAIFCLSDYTALRMLTDLSHMGFMIPEDISLVGYGNLAFAQQCKMTSIEEQLVVIGERAVDTLLKEINDSMHKSFYEETLELFDVKLVVRDSTTTCN